MEKSLFSKNLEAAKTVRERYSRKTYEKLIDLFAVETGHKIIIESIYKTVQNENLTEEEVLNRMESLYLKYAQVAERDKTTIDICFSDSAHGNIKWFLHDDSDINRIKDYINAFYSTNKDIESAFSHPTKKVFSFTLWFDQYGINAETFEQGRMEVLSHYYERPCNAKRRYNIYMQDIQRIISEAKQGTTIRIWHSQSAFALCGLYYIANILKDIEAEIFIVPLPENDDYLDWAQMNPGIMAEYLELVHKASTKELQQYSQEWERLCDENSDLRITVDGKVMSVGIDYYDEVIYQSFNKEKTTIQALIAESINDVWDYGNNVVLDGFICERILELIDKGRFEIIDSYGGENYDDIYPPYIIRKVK